MARKLILILFILFICIIASGCTPREKVENSCYISKGNPLSDIDVNVVCIDGVQYIKSGYGISAYWRTDTMGNARLRTCNCSNIK